MSDIRNASGVYTFTDYAALFSSKGVKTIGEVLARRSELWENMRFQEANEKDRETFLRRATYPVGSPSVINSGNAIEASKMIPFEEELLEFISWSRVDSRLLEKFSEGKEEARTRFDMGNLAGLGITMDTAFLYGNIPAGVTRTNLEAAFPGSTSFFSSIHMVNGIRQRYNALSTAGVWSAGGATTNTQSCAIVLSMGPETFYCAYPKGAPFGGVSMTDEGESLVYDAVGPYKAFLTRFVSAFGIVVVDPRAVQVVVNIQTDPAGAGFSADNTARAIVRAIENAEPGERTVVVMNRRVRSILKESAIYKTNVMFNPNGPWGGRQEFDINGVQILIADTIINTEAPVT